MFPRHTPFFFAGSRSSLLIVFFFFKGVFSEKEFFLVRFVTLPPSSCSSLFQQILPRSKPPVYLLLFVEFWNQSSPLPPFSSRGLTLPREPPPLRIPVFFSRNFHLKVFFSSSHCCMAPRCPLFPCFVSSSQARLPGFVGVPFFSLR